MSTSSPVVSLSITIGGSAAGNISILLHADIVPKTADNFLKLCTGSEGFSYVGTPFHCIVPNFAAQGGDITNGNGTGGKSINGTRFADENFILKHKPGAWLDGKHVVFGEVIEGMDVAKMIEGNGTQSGKPIKTIIISDCRQLF